MFILKLIGAALIVFSGAFMGIYSCKMLKQRREFLENVIAVTLAIKEQICFFKRSLSQIYEVLIKSGFDSEFVNALKNTDNPEEYLKNFYCLTPKDKQLILELFSSLGMSDAKGEEERILVYIKLFEKQLAEADTDFFKKAKLYKSIGLWGGVSVAIFLI